MNKIQRKSKDNWFLLFVERWINFKILVMRRALKNRIPAQCIWRTGYQTEFQDMPQYGGSEWIYNRLKYSHLGLFAAEKIFFFRRWILTPCIATLSFFALIFCSISLFSHSQGIVFLISLFLFSLVGYLVYLGLGKSKVSYFFVPKKLLSTDDKSAVDRLLNNTVIRQLPPETPNDLQDQWRNLDFDAQGKSVIGQILSSDLEISSLYLQLHHVLSHIMFFAAYCGLLFVSYFWGGFGHSYWLFGILSPVFLLFPLGNIIYLFITRSPMQRRMKSSVIIANNASSELVAHATGRKFFESIEEAKRLQIENAIKDTSHFFKLGTTTGKLSERRDPFAVTQANMPFGLSCNDLATHMLILGITGSGKTSGVIRPLAKQWIDHNIGGLLAIDGKGVLPEELANLSADYKLISPEHDQFNPIYNLSADDVADTFAAIFATPNKQDDFFDRSATILIRWASVVLANSQKDYNLPNLYQLISNPDYQQALIATVKNSDSYLNLALNYFAIELPSMVDKTRSSIIETAKSWFIGILGHQALHQWVDCNTGVSIENTLTGEKIGLLLPESRYGQAGSILSMFAMRRLYRAIKNRGDKSVEKSDQNPVMLLVDEAQKVISKGELDILPIARSLGLYCVFSTQNIDGVFENLGQYGGQQFLGGFRNLVALPVETEASNHFLESRIGTTWRSIPVGSYEIADSAQDIKFYLNNACRAVSEYSDMQRRRLPRSQGFATSFCNEVWEDVKEVTLGTVKAISPEKKDRNSRIEIGLQPIVQAKEISTLLAVPMTALVSIQRGQVARRDIVKLG